MALVEFLLNIFKTEDRYTLHRQTHRVSIESGSLTKNIGVIDLKLTKFLDCLVIGIILADLMTSLLLNLYHRSWNILTLLLQLHCSWNNINKK